MKTALLKRLERLETVQGVGDRNRPPKIEFAYLKLLPREYTGPRHIVKVGQREDGRDECEERPGKPPPNQGGGQDEDRNVMTIYFVSARETSDETR